MTKAKAGKPSAAKKPSTKKPTPKNEEAVPNPRVEALEDIKLRGLFLHGYAITINAAPVIFDTEEFRGLVDQFYEENRDIVTPAIHRACRENYEFFMTMVERALNHFNTPPREDP